MALDLTGEEGGDDLFKILFEGISMADGVHTLDDLDVFMRKKMRGGTFKGDKKLTGAFLRDCLLYTSPSPRDATLSRMPSSA